MKANVTYERLVPVTIAGQAGYFNFSTAAAKVIMRDYGGLGKVGEKMDDEDEDAVIDITSDIFALLLGEGAKYVRILSRFGGGDESPCDFTAEELQTLLNLDDLRDLTPKFQEAVKIGSGRNVEVKPDPKNAKTGQGK